MSCRKKKKMKENKKVKNKTLVLNFRLVTNIGKSKFNTSTIQNETERKSNEPLPSCFSIWKRRNDIKKRGKNEGEQKLYV